MSFPKPIPLQERIRLALEHIEQHGGGETLLWPYQDFSMSVGQLLREAKREQAVDDARYKPPAFTPPTDALAPQSGKKEDGWLPCDPVPSELVNFIRDPEDAVYTKRGHQWYRFKLPPLPSPPASKE